MNQVKLQVEIKDAKLCPRYQAVVMELPKRQPDNYLLPMQTFIARSGMRSIDRVVDITNELMLLTGQPLHAFDYDKLVQVGGLDTAKIIVRAAKKGEKLELLDSKTIEMDDGDIVITSNDVPVALAGAMGGMNTAIDKNTKRIVLESATFNLYNLRGTQFRHGIFSEAITRFTKGQPPALTEPVIRKAVEVYAEYCGARAISEVADAYPEKIENLPIDITAKQVNDLLGTNLTYLEIEKILTNIGYEFWCDRGAESACDCEVVHVKAPYWRTDIHIPEDVIEDIGRINGFDGIKPTLPRRDFAAVNLDAMAQLKDKIRNSLAAAGANEVLTYSFVHGNLLQKVGQDPDNSYKIVNSISPDLQYYRQSLTPSLLDKAYVNLKAGYESFALFEINKVHQKKWGQNDENVPIEKTKLALTLLDKQQSGAAYYQAKKYLDNILVQLGIKAKFVPLLQDNATDTPFDIKRRAKVEEAKTGQVLGVIGEYKTSVRKAFKLPEQTAGFELILDAILEFAHAERATDYRPLGKYPSVERDLTFQVSSDLEYVELENLIRKTLDETKLQFELASLSIYQGDDQKHKNISFRLTFASYDKTLTGDEIASIIKQIAEAAPDLKAKVV
jgi:phenylalanyl-tRNA synthetase beta chain